MALSKTQILLILGMLLTGSINTLSKKAQNDCVVIGRPKNSSDPSSATAHSFDHPWFQTVIMFIGEMLCLIGLAWQRLKERKEFRKKNMASIQNTAGEVSTPMIPIEGPLQPRIFQFIFAIPTICDLFGTTLGGIGLVYVNASVWQMLRGSIIIFAGILSKIFLKRKLRCVHWSGMIVTMLGLVLVGISSVFEEEGSGNARNNIIGIALILGGQLVSSSQMIIEEIFLKRRGYHPLQVVGMEGTFGFLFMCFLILPVLYFIPDKANFTGRYEDSLDALYQLKNSVSLLVFSFLYLLSIAFYNYFGLAVTKSLTAVHRTLIDACRTIVVWLSSLFIHYVIDAGFGEGFNVTYGILQIDGFFLLLIGTALYNELVDVPCIPCLSNYAFLPPDLEDTFESSGTEEDDYTENSSLLQNERKYYTS